MARIPLGDNLKDSGWTFTMAGPESRETSQIKNGLNLSQLQSQKDKYVEMNGYKYGGIPWFFHVFPYHRECYHHKHPSNMLHFGTFWWWSLGTDVFQAVQREADLGRQAAWPSRYRG